MSETEKTTQTIDENQINHYAIRGRIEIMKRDCKVLRYHNRYLARKLRRSPTAITFALNGHRPLLLKRIAKHLDSLQKKIKVSAPKIDG